MTLCLLALGLSLGVGSARADTVYTMPSARLSLGQALGRDPDTAEEAYIVLVGLLDERSLASEASEALWALSVGTSCRASWQPMYARVARSTSISRTRREALGAHAKACRAPSAPGTSSAPPSEDSEALLGRARELLAAARPEEAWPVAIQAVQARPGDGAALWQLAQSGFATGRGTEVLTWWRAAIASAGPGTPHDQLAADLGVVHGLRGETLKREGSVVAAIEAYSLAVAMRPDRSDLWAGLGGALWGTDRPAALQAYLESLVRDPTRVDPLIAAAMLSLDAGDLESAAVLLAHTPATSKAAEEARGRLRIAPMLREIATISTNDREAGLSGLKRLVSGQRADPVVLEAIGYAQLRLAAPEEAATTFRLASTLAEDSVSARLGEGLASLASGDSAAAEAILLELEGRASTATGRDPAPLRLALLRSRAVAAAAQGDRRGARDRFAALVRANPADGWSWVGLGELFLAEGAPEAAGAYFDWAAAHGDRQDGALQCTAFEGTLRALVLADRAAEAERAAARGMCSNPAEGWLAIGSAALQSGDVQLARRAAGRATAIAPDAAGVRALECRVMSAEGEFDAAFRCASRLLSTNPRAESAALALAESAHGPVPLAQAAAILGDAAAVAGSPAIARRAEATALAAVLARAGALAKDGDPRAAALLLGEAAERADGDVASLLAIATGLLSVDATTASRAAYAAVLSTDPRSADAWVGEARVLQAEGRPLAALRGLQAHIDADPQPVLLLAAARMAMDLGDRARARSLLAQSEAIAAAPGAQLERVPLPDGSAPAAEGGRDNPVGGFAALLAPARPDSGDWRTRETEVVRAQLDAPITSTSSVSVLGFNQSGQLGEGWLAGVGALVSSGDLPVGPVSGRVDAMPVWVSDGLRAETGVALLAGMTWRGGRFGAHGSLGSSPIGFSAAPTLVGDARVELRWSALTLGLAAARVPLTDSLTSWAGSWEEGRGDFTGRAAYSWLGVDFAARAPGAYSAMGSFRGGEVDWLGDWSVGRSELTLAAARRFEGLGATLRLGPVFSWTAHTRGLAAYGEHGSGAFIPKDDVLAALRLDGASPPGSGPRLCGRASLGVESVAGLPGTADARDGTRLSLSLGGGVTVPAGARSAIQVIGTWRTSGFEWYQLGVGVGWVPRAGAHSVNAATPAEPLGGLLASPYDCAT